MTSQSTASRAEYLSEWRKKNAEKSREHTRRWREKNKHKRAAHRKVEVKLRNGSWTSQPCEKCGNVKAQAHHDDYAKPLDVIWLCDSHHKMRHAILTQLGKNPD